MFDKQWKHRPQVKDASVLFLFISAAAIARILAHTNVYVSYFLERVPPPPLKERHLRISTTLWKWFARDKDEKKKPNSSIKTCYINSLKEGQSRHSSLEIFQEDLSSLSDPDRIRVDTKGWFQNCSWYNRMQEIDIDGEEQTVICFVSVCLRNVMSTPKNQSCEWALSEYERLPPSNDRLPSKALFRGNTECEFWIFHNVLPALYKRARYRTLTFCIWQRSAYSYQHFIDPIGY